MALFNKHDGPFDQKKPNSIIDVIKYEDENQSLIYKYNIEDFNYGTQLIVHESQEAIFFLDGQALDTFGPGRYTLETQNLPLLSKLYKIPTGGTNPFHCEVYFINKTTQMGIKWGTDSRVRFVEPQTGIPLNIGASGEYNFQIVDSRKLLVKLVGTDKALFNGRDAQPHQGNGDPWLPVVKEYFRPHLMTSVKTNIASAIKQLGINILEIDEHLEALSNSLRDVVSAGFEEYGITVPQFYITNVRLPEEDSNFQKLKSLIADAYLKVKEQEVAAEIASAERQRILEQEKTRLEQTKVAAEIQRIQGQAAADVKRAEGFAEADIMHAKGYDMKDRLEADVQMAYAEGIGNMGGSAGAGGNGGGGIIGDVLGATVAINAMNPILDKVGGAMSGFGGSIKDSHNARHGTNADTWTCGCGAENSGKFCSECGKAKPELWECPKCGAKCKGKFCSECGTAKPEAWDCPHCGATGNKGKFCSECGKSPEEAVEAPATWTCPTCGLEGITGKFCSECGYKKEEE